MSIHMKRGVAALGVAALALTTGVLSATAASGEEGAPTVTGLMSALAGDDSIQAIGQGEAGKVVLVTDKAEAELEGAAADAAAHDNVDVFVVPDRFTAFADTDVVGGAGYFTAPADAEAGGLCSVGFTGWNAEGEPAVISAGHCTDDNASDNAALTVPSGDPSGGGAADNSDVALLHPLGVLGASQYGGPGNSAGAENDPASVDIAAYDVTNDELNLLPEVTDWSNTSDLSASTTPVKAVGTAAVGDTINRSGRTTRPSSGQVVIEDGWAQISKPGDPSDVRWVHGFGVLGMAATSGDSGGSMVRGETAVGVLSGGGETETGELMVWGADLQGGLAQLGGDYTVALDLDEPALTSPEDGGTVGRGDAITGTGPAGGELTITSEGREDQTVDIDGEGNWTFNAVEELGTYEFSLTATRGFDTSDTVDFSVEVAATGPAITAPENGSTVVGSVNAISGTGEPGAEVTVAGDASGTATVDGEGNWSVEVNLGPGEYRVSATQVVDGDESAVTSSSFTVIPDAPVITTPEDGVSYRAATAPEGAEGTGIEDATITVFLNDEEIGETTVENGEWNVAFEDGLQAGDYTLRAVQTVNEQSNDAGVSFALLEDAAAPGPGDDLPRTGIAAMLPYILGGAALLAAGGAAMEIRRRRGLGDIA